MTRGWRAPRRAWPAAEQGRLLRDTTLALALAIFAVAVIWIGSDDEPSRAPGPLDVIAIVVMVTAVVVRRKWSGWSIAAVTVTAVALTAVGHETPVLIVALFFLFHTHAGSGDRRITWLLAAGVAVLLYFGAVAWADGGWWSPENLGVLAWIGMATAVGDAARSRRAYVTAIEERALHAEQTREEEARRRVLGERVRIARELHDVVAHHIAVIKVQATGARHILTDHPDQAATALTHISRSSDTVLQEMASVIGLLRSPDEPPDPTTPTPGLIGLAALLDDFAAAGLRVDHQQHGQTHDLPAVADLAAYRIVQESLTNAHKHGAGTAKVTVDYSPQGVVVEVSNPVRPGANSTGSGYGIVGMRERASVAGGSLLAGPVPGGDFVVRADLPAADRTST